MGKQSKPRPLNPKVERRLINDTVNVSEQTLALLREHPDWAHRLGNGIEYKRREFEAAYPGQTRTARVPVAVWEKEGLDKMAEFMRLTGLKGA